MDQSSSSSAHNKRSSRVLVTKILEPAHVAHARHHRLPPLAKPAASQRGGGVDNPPSKDFSLRTPGEEGPSQIFKLSLKRSSAIYGRPSAVAPSQSSRASTLRRQSAPTSSDASQPGQTNDVSPSEVLDPTEVQDALAIDVVSAAMSYAMDVLSLDIYEDNRGSGCSSPSSAKTCSELGFVDFSLKQAAFDTDPGRQQHQHMANLPPLGSSTTVSCAGSSRGKEKLPSLDDLLGPAHSAAPSRAGRSSTDAAPPLGSRTLRQHHRSSRHMKLPKLGSSTSSRAPLTAR